MKGTCIIILVILLVNLSCEKKISTNDIPLSMQYKIDSMYPNNTNIHWVREIKTYEARFLVDSMEHFIAFDLNGKLHNKVFEINKSDMPSEILKVFIHRYNNAVNLKYFKDEGSVKTSYHIEMTWNNGNYKVFFAPDGKVIKQVKNLK